MARKGLSALANKVGEVAAFTSGHTVFKAITGSGRVFSHRFLSSQATNATEDVEEWRDLAEAGATPVDVSYPTYMVWGSNTGVGKTLVSAGARIRSSG